VLSGTHGVEGLAGSGCQVAWLNLTDNADLPDGTAVLFVHLLNPWGCAWQRRQNEDNVDINRNFCDFDAGLPANPLYDAVHDIVLNRDHAVRAAQDPRIADFRNQHGDRGLANALFSGQYGHSDGVGYGGRSPTWSHTTLNAIFKKYAARAKSVTVLDIHTGIGPYGYGTIMSVDPAGSAAYERVRDRFGPGVVVLNEDPTMPYKIGGTILEWSRKAIKAEVTSIALEFGTFDVHRLLDLQVDDCRLVNYEETWSGFGGEIRKDLVDFFFPATKDWMQSAVMRSLQVITQSISGH
jgi:hypothetical protein